MDIHYITYVTPIEGGEGWFYTEVTELGIRRSNQFSNL